MNFMMTNLINLRPLPIIFIVFWISGCGGSGNENNGSDSLTATLTLSYSQPKTFHFEWNNITDATHYKLLENPDGASGFTQVGIDIPGTINFYNHIVPLHEKVNAQYILETCFPTECKQAKAVSVSDNLIGSIGYLKSSNNESGDLFGYETKLSADGTTLAVSAFHESSNSTGVNGDQENNIASNSGAVYVFVKINNNWQQQAYLKASNNDPDDGFGVAISLSADGNTLAVSATGEDSLETGINGDQSDDSTSNSGAVYIFRRVSNVWAQQAYIKASNTGGDDRFGYAISLSGDGNTLAVSALNEDSSSTGIDGNQGDSSSYTNSGAVYIFYFSSDTWIQQSYLKASDTQSLDNFGFSLSLNDDGNILAIGAPQTENASRQSDYNSGSVYIFKRSSGIWEQTTLLTSSQPGFQDFFGFSTALDSAGNTLVVGAGGDSNSINNLSAYPANSSSKFSGAVYIYALSGGIWDQQAYLKASNIDAGDEFGFAVSLNQSGNILAIGAPGESSNGKGVQSNQIDNSMNHAGAVYVFYRNTGVWTQKSYLKASNPDAGDFFGSTLSVTGDGGTLVVGSSEEDSFGTGVAATQNDNSAINSGAAYLY
jgi:trimeric autotransporter adhesin